MDRVHRHPLNAYRAAGGLAGVRWSAWAIALLCGCLEGPSPPDDGDAQRRTAGTDEATDVPLHQAGDFVVDYTARWEECASGSRFTVYSRSATSVTIDRPANATRLDVTFSWTAPNDLAERMRFLLVDPDGRDTGVEAEGPSPVVLALDAAALQLTTADPWLAGEPAPCGSAPTGVGASPGQTVHYEALWS